MRIERPHSATVLAFLAVALGIAFVAHALEVSNVTVTETTETTATISWDTDADADALINYGTDPSGGVARDPSFSGKKHSIILEDLDPSTKYYFSVSSADSSGNRNTAAGFVFTTKSANNIPNAEKIATPEDRAAVERVVAAVQQITDPTALAVVVSEVQERAGDVIKPPSIVGLPKVVALADTATISWTTDRPSNSIVKLATDAEYQGGGADPYTLTQGDSRSSTTKHSVEVVGLEPSTLYHFQVISEDALGLEGSSEDDTFRTKSLLPEIVGLKVSRVQEKSATVSWATGGVLAKGIVEYKNLRTNVTRSSGNPIFATQHSINLSGLELGTRYSVTAISTNEGGEQVVSDPITFVTVRDVVEPLISKVKNESTLFPGEDVKIQTIIAWETDEAATCQVFYTQGLVKDEDGGGDSLPEELNPVSVHTQVVIGLAPATVYKYWVVCRDESRNQSQSEDYVLITPIKEKSIIDIILENFEGTFGWVKNISQ